jgi:hypothetical protein
MSFPGIPYRMARRWIDGWVELSSLERLQASPGQGDFASVEKEERETEPSKERSFTELRFASFPLQFCGTERAIKGRDERPSGALDSPLRLCLDGDLFFLLTPPTLS